MMIILGATGQVGSILVTELLNRNERVRIAVRNTEKALPLKENGAEVFVADYQDASALKAAFNGCDTAFLITPENPFLDDVLTEADKMLNCYREAVLATGISDVVGLSSGGAQHESGTGNLMVSHRLEKLFEGTQVRTSFIRPAYYFSNWIGYLDIAKESGILPSFFATKFRVAMIAPNDVAMFAADVVTAAERAPIYEIYNDYYCSEDIAQFMGQSLGRDVSVAPILPDDWMDTLRRVGFSESGASNLVEMTDAVITGKTKPEGELIKLPTDFKNYLSHFCSAK